MKLRKRNKYFCFDSAKPYDLKYWIKRVLSPVFDVFAGVLVRSVKRDKQASKMYELVFCGIFKNESPFLAEWLNYHRNLGVEHFFLYNNNSEDNYIEVLAPYIDQGWVTLTDWPMKQLAQMPAYEHFWANFAQQSRWVALIDMDEFCCPKYETDLKKWLKKYQPYPSVVFYWKIFGTSGRLEHDFSRLVTEQYTVCFDRMSDIGKAFFQTDFIYKEMYHHTIYAKIRWAGRTWFIPPVNEFGKFVFKDIHRVSRGGQFTMQLNHYLNKAYHEAVERKYARGEFYLLVSRDLNERMVGFFENEHYCTAVDYTIYRFLIELKLAMNNPQ